METNRLEAFSDAVLAIVMTIMVLELKVPDDAHLEALQPLLPEFLTYLFSFLYLGIYWNNHHHLMHAVNTVNGKILWANLNLLFWLSLFPFVTGWMGENHFQLIPVVFYGIVLLMAAVAYRIMAYLIVQNEGKESMVGQAIGRDHKGNLSIVLYAIGIGLSFYEPVIGLACYLGAAMLWLVPDKRIEKLIFP